MKRDQKHTGSPAPHDLTPDGSGAPQDKLEPDQTLSVHAEKGWVIVELPDYPAFPEEHTARELRERLYKIVDSRGVQLELDLSHVHHASSFFITSLVTLHRRIRDMGGRLVLRNLDPHLQQLLRACKLDRIFEDCSG